MSKRLPKPGETWGKGEGQAYVKVVGDGGVAFADVYGDTLIYKLDDFLLNHEPPQLPEPSVGSVWRIKDGVDGPLTGRTQTVIGKMGDTIILSYPSDLQNVFHILRAVPVNKFYEVFDPQQS